MLAAKLLHGSGALRSSSTLPVRSDGRASIDLKHLEVTMEVVAWVPEQAMVDAQPW